MAGYDLDRFKKAQAGDYALALEEINAGRKRWMHSLMGKPMQKPCSFCSNQPGYTMKQIFSEATEPGFVHWLPGSGR